ncbi:hypothetical protein TD95_001279 [Thielaviopsis punctulata]|uniref:Thymidylate kinase n=1 Tax=Thielaviopsis punctulata TaxID=72032 RepID=A0A0F4ZC98_9PEZI|nr:hypothetical protein TD95_001279 [Thielaviopsis punctulata]
MASINDLATVAIATSSSSPGKPASPGPAITTVATSFPSTTTINHTIETPPPPATATAAATTAIQPMALDTPEPAAADVAVSAEPQAQNAIPAPAEDAAQPETAPPQGDAPESQAKKRGALIVLEGLDRSGKSTQVKLLQQRFIEDGRKAKIMRFPGRTTPIGKMIDAYLKNTSTMDDHVIHLLFSANRWEAARAIADLLASGTSVLCDRYYYSGIVYSAAKQNPSLPLLWARQPEIGLPRPDLVVFLNLDEETARQRGGWGDEVYEKKEMQMRVKELFVTLGAGGVQELGADTAFQQEREDLKIVDASADIEQVSDSIWARVEPVLAAVDKGDFGAEVRVVS